MAEAMVQMVICGAEIEVPRGCAGTSSLNRCPGLEEIINAGRKAIDESLLQGIASAAVSFAKQAKGCEGCDFRDSDSGITWRKECPVTGRIQNS